MANGGNPALVQTPQGGAGAMQQQFSAPRGQPNVFGQAANALSTAQGAATGAATYSPQSLGGRSLSRYQNPFQQQVIDTTLGDIERSRQMGLNDVGAAATRAGAFGGSRLGVAEAETNRAAMDAVARASGQLRSQGFSQAQGAAQQDISNQLAAQGLNLNAAGQLGSLSNLGFGMGQSIQQQQMQQGTMQQALQQQLIDAARAQYGGFTGQPAASTQAPLQALGTVPYGQTQTQTQQPGLFNYLSLGLGLL